MPRSTTLAFRLSTGEAQQHLVQELSLHHGVTVRAVEADDPHVIVVEAVSDASTWEIRATVGAFDEKAVELEAQP